jgi:hypothetical protein
MPRSESSSSARACKRASLARRQPGSPTVAQVMRPYGARRTKEEFMSEHRPVEDKPPAKFTWREARPDDPMFGKIYIVPIRTRIAEEEPGILGETKDRPHGDEGKIESQ